MHCLKGTYLKEITMEEILENQNRLEAQAGQDTQSQEEKAKKLHPIKLVIPPNKSRLIFLTNKDDQQAWMERLQKANGTVNVFQYYTLDKTLGQGQFGTVKLATHKKTRKQVAIKQVKKKDMNYLEVLQQRREIEVLKICQHPNIINLVDLFENSDHYFIVLDYMAGNDLFDYLFQRNFNLGEERVCEIVYQMALGLKYLHSYGIVHRDLKLENVMMTDSSSTSVPKLVDFGLAKIIGPNEHTTEPFGTLGYVAPEILKKEPYTAQCDLWSLGCIVYALSSGSLPFDDEKQNEVRRMTCEDPLEFDGATWNKYSTESKDLIKRLLHKSPEARITLDDTLAHPWFQTARDKFSAE